MHTIGGPRVEVKTKDDRNQNVTNKPKSSAGRAAFAFITDPVANFSSGEFRPALNMTSPCPAQAPKGDGLFATPPRVGTPVRAFLLHGREPYLGFSWFRFFLFSFCFVVSVCHFSHRCANTRFLGSHHS